MPYKNKSQYTGLFVASGISFIPLNFFDKQILSSSRKPLELVQNPSLLY